MERIWNGFVELVIWGSVRHVGEQFDFLLPVLDFAVEGDQRCLKDCGGYVVYN